MWAAGGERAEDLDPFRQDKAPRSEEVGFAHDSALEGDGFELSVPRERKANS
jgi:hypothetical protein